MWKPFKQDKLLARQLTKINFSLIALVGAFVIGCTSGILHSELIQLYKQANQLYEKREYLKAAELYEIIASKISNSNVYYNLGNTYFKLGQRGKAILYYERARQLMPRDKDIRRNLRYAISLNEDKQFAPFNSILNSLITINELTVLILGFSMSLASGAIVYILFDDARIKKITRYAMLILGGTLLLCFIILILSVHTSGISRAIVLIPEITVKSAPDEGSTVLFSLHEGTMVEIKEIQAKWAKINLPDGTEGWIASSAIERI
ncbi:TPA: tetratricopeptide repeat protein [Candidatus Poribacteria bacterium]|nr:tetratricopeptide repeat protein [Candidatus Poribacteria bacterium]